MSDQETSGADYGVIWDFDGTLVDTMPVHFTAWQEFMTAHGHQLSLEEFRANAGKPAAQILRTYFPAVSPGELEELADRKDSLYRQAAVRDGVALAPGAEELVRALHAAGFKQAIASGTPRANLELAYAQLPWLADFIEVAVVAGDTSEVKPDPAVFLLAARRLDLAPARCLVVEDGVLGIEAARRAGMPSIGVLTGGQTAAQLTAQGTERVVATLEEITLADIRALLV